MENKKYCSECGRELLKVLNPITKSEITQACSCVIEKAEREKEVILKTGLEKLKKKIFSENGIGRKYSGITLNDIIAVKGQEKAINETTEFLKRFSADRNTNGFGLFGGVGSGKTYIVSALINQLCNERAEAFNDYEKEEAYFGRISTAPPARFISCIELLEKIKADNSTIRKYKTAELLVIDDFGAARITEWADEKLFEIVDYRYAQELPIIFTTNITPAELKTKIDNRTFDRISEVCSFVSVTAPTQRKVNTL